MVIFVWKIGDIEIKNRVVLAPMASISNSAYRTIIKEMGCGLIFAEMVSDKAVQYKNKKTIDLLYMTDYERPIAQQIFGSDIESFKTAAKFIEEFMKPDIIDINMGCPVPKVALRAQAGSALLKHPEKVYEIVKEIKETVSVPVTVKIRSGWDDKSINAIEIAKLCEKAGASAISIHARTRAQGYSGKANWDIIRQVKAAVSIPVIGNGDVRTPQDAKRMLDETGCDAVMIGRGVLGNPWLIKDTIEYLESSKLNKEITLKEKIEMLKKHFEYLINTKPDKLALLEIRSHIAWYLKGYPNLKEFKQELMFAKSKEHFNDVIERFVIENDV